MSLGYFLRSSHFTEVMEHRLGYGFRRLLSASENVCRSPGNELAEIRLLGNNTVCVSVLFRVLTGYDLVGVLLGFTSQAYVRLRKACLCEAVCDFG
jgi:hypothetical protein